MSLDTFDSDWLSQPSDLGLNNPFPLESVCVCQASRNPNEPNQSEALMHSADTVTEAHQGLEA
jgi:hypothetical protein